MKFLGTKKLETDRLILRKINNEDYKDAYVTWCNDEDIVKYTVHGVHKNIDVTKRVYERWIQEYEDEKTFRWIIELKENHKVIGTIDVSSPWIKYGTLEPGYVIGKEYWGKGYATEATKEVIRYLFEECDADTIYSEHMENNIGSGRVMQKSGLVFEARLKSRVVDREGNRQDLLSYVLTKDEYFHNKVGENNE